MAFKEIQQSTTIPDSPERLFLDLPRRKIPGVLPHQQELMQAYTTTALEDSDVALQLPTGSGKTLAGLLIGEWRRRKFNERVVYLSPTKQLVNQVVEQAEEKYGITVHGFSGPSKDYDPVARADYKSAARIAITTYSSLFNTSPFFDDADVIIVDDAHAAENYVSAMWSVRIDRTNVNHAAVHLALCSLLKPLLEPFNYTRLLGQIESPSDRSWVDKVPTPEFIKILPELTEILDTHSKGTDLSYSWQMVKSHLEACHLYLSSQEILIRPLIPPTWDHLPFANAKQRIYMSATLGAGGDLERLVGRAPIKRLPIAEGWDSHGVGRRFFVFPEMSLNEDETKNLRLEMMKQTDRSLVLVPSIKLRDEIQGEIESKTSLQVFSASDIEASKSPFIQAKSATAIIANRYDGIDFPGDECRLLFVEGLPRAMNLQEKFLMSKMGANALFNERIQTRVLQAIGRCTRSLEDYSAVVVSGEELPDYLADPHKRPYFHPELQAELLFGAEQSKEMDSKGLLENLRVFLENGEGWEKVNQQIVATRKGMTKMEFPAMDELQASVGDEIDYEKKMWQKDYEAALGSADRVLEKLKAPELKGYRALWHYLAGSAAWLAVNAGGTPALAARAQDEFARARDAATMIPWLVSLARYSGAATPTEDIDNSIVLEQVERIESVLADLGTTYDRSYANREKEILDGIVSRDPENSKPFENAHKLLGEMLGFESNNQETDGSPDPWWISANICLVFEDHAGAKDGTVIDIQKARQASSHPAWIRANVPSAAAANILPILITPATSAKEAAMAHLESVSIWNLEDFQKWALAAVSVVRELRKTFTDPGDLVWRTDAVTALKKHGFDAISLIKKLQAQRAIDLLKSVH